MCRYSKGITRVLRKKDFLTYIYHTTSEASIKRP